MLQFGILMRLNVLQIRIIVRKYKTSKKATTDRKSQVVTLFQQCQDCLKIWRMIFST